MPLVNTEVYAQLIDVLDEVPRRVVLERREPGTTQHRHQSDSAAEGARWRSQRGLAHGVDLPVAGWVSVAIYINVRGARDVGRVTTYGGEGGSGAVGSAHVAGSACAAGSACDVGSAAVA